MKHIQIALTAASLIFTAIAANAGTVLVDNLDYANAAQQAPYIVSGPLGNGDYGIGELREAVSFTVPTAGDYYLSEISVLGEYVSGNPNDLQLALYESNGVSKRGTANGLPLTQIASQTVAIDTAYTDFKKYTADFGTGTLLTAGQTYWAVVQSTDKASDLLFAVQDGTSLGTHRTSMYGNMGRGSGSWMYMDQAGLKVTGTPVPVPEPSGLIAIVGGLSGLGTIIRRKRS